MNKARLHRERMSLSGTAAGWLSESQQPAAALAFIAFGVTVLVTTIDSECTARANVLTGTIRTTELMI